MIGVNTEPQPRIIEEKDYWGRTKISCIYFMFLRGVLIYIGQTVDLRSRMQGHEYEWMHDSLRWIPCDKSKLKYYEKRWILLLKPTANVTWNINNPNRKDYNFKAPRWIYWRSQMFAWKYRLDSGDYHDRESCELEYLSAKLRYDYYITHNPFKNTFLWENITSKRQMVIK